MVSIIYHRLFNLMVSHTYYTAGIFPGVALLPDHDTKTLLQQGRMLLKYLPEQTVVLFRGIDNNPVNPFVNLGDNFKFTFGLKVKNKSEFLNITNLKEGTKEYESGHFLHFRNNPAAPSPETITHSLIDTLRNDLFTYEFQLAPASGTVDLTLQKINDDGSLTAVSTGKDVQGNPLPTTIPLHQNDKNEYQCSIDIRRKELGRYKITIEPGGGGPVLKEETLYVHPELLRQDVIGVIEILYDSTGRAYDAIEEYDIHFESKSTVWKYHIVNKSGNFVFPADNMKINHPEFTPPIGGAGPHSTIRINDKPTVIISSDDTIPFTEIPELSIELQRNSDDETFVEHLPNPSINQNVKKEGSALTSEIFVFL